MKTNNANKFHVLIFVLALILTGMLVAGCASQTSAPAASAEPIAAGSQQNSEATEEPTLPPIPTRAVGKLPTSMVLIQKPGETTQTAASAAAGPVDCNAPAALTPSATEGPESSKPAHPRRPTFSRRECRAQNWC